MAIQAELQRDRKKRRKPYSADDFDPFAHDRRGKASAGSVTFTKEHFRSWGSETFGKR